jgi:thioredoxin reductase
VKKAVNLVTYDLIIIGGGPAGIGAALHSGRTGIKVLLIEAGEPGGRLGHADWIRNFPLAAPKGCPGRKITRQLSRQLKNSGTVVLNGRCRKIDQKGQYFTAQVGGKRYLSKSAILATGLPPKKLTVKGAKEAYVNNLMHQYWDEIPGRLNGKLIVVIGGGEVALDQARSLASRGCRTTVLVRGGRVKAYPDLLKKALACGVNIRYGFSLTRIVCEDRGLSLAGRDGSIFHCQAAVAAIGSGEPRSILTARARKFVNKGLYLAGDLANRDHRQAAIAFGDGVIKAELALRHLNS